MPRGALNSNGEYITIRQTNRQYGFGERCWRKAVADGELTLYQLPGSWPRLRRSDVEAYIERRRIDPPSPPTPNRDPIADRVEAAIRREDSIGAT